MDHILLYVVVPLLLIALVLALYILWVKDFDYTCGHCRATFSLPLLNIIFAPKWMTMRLVRCPACGKRSWAAPVQKEK